MLGTIGGTELLLILVIALIVFGPRKLPEIGKSIGKMMGEFRRASNDFRRTIEDEVEAEKAPSEKTPSPPLTADETRPEASLPQAPAPEPSLPQPADTVASTPELEQAEKN
jgi:TatA/E family protein of Tat protein translocase